MKAIIKDILKKIGIFNFLKNIKEERIRRSRLTKYFKFENRKKDREKVCFVLAGYKEFTYDIIFKRIKEFIPDDIEVCVLSSGIYSKKLSNIAKNNDWSYISTKRNNVSLIQNVAITQFEKAKYIYKLDEDIFVTNGFFETLFRTYNDCMINGEYKPGIIVPTIPINGFGHLNVLKRFNLVDYYTKSFEKPIYAAGPDRMIENNPEVAMFFWGKENFIPQIDKMNETLRNDEFNYIACPIRFSIGAILYTREFWKDMKMFKVYDGPGMGKDEEDICEFCINTSKAIIVSLNTAVGHLSFGKQNKTMEEYFKNNKMTFEIK